MSAYKEMQTDFRIFSPAYVLQTGIGVAASYTVSLGGRNSFCLYRRSR